MTCLFCISNKRIQQKLWNTHLNSSRNHKSSGIHISTKASWIIKYERTEEEKEGEEGEMNWNYGTGESIIYEVGFSSEMAPEKRDAPKLRRVPPCTPLTSRPTLSPATFLISLFSQSNLLFSLCLLIFTTTCVFI